jgi:phage tail protein X
MSRRMLIGSSVVLMLVSCGALSFPQQFSATEIVGGRGGDEFADFQPPAGARVAEVRVRAGDTIDALQIVYALPNGRTTMGPRHGGGGGSQTIFRLDADEYIIGLAGRHGDTIDSLSIITNRRTSTRFGGNGGDRRFRVEVPSGCYAMGFTGRAGATVDAIGLMYMPLPRRRDDFPSSRGGRGGIQEGQTELAGGIGGRPFADSEPPLGARITEIRVRAGDTIDAVQAIYMTENGRYLEGQQHGGRGGNERIFRLDRDEFVIALEGRHGDTVDSLRIVTNKRTSQRFGGGGGNRNYRIEVPPGNSAIGFCGRAGNTVDAIGLVFARTGFRR